MEQRRERRTFGVGVREGTEKGSGVPIGSKGTLSPQKIGERKAGEERRSQKRE